jgi:hypothetical protein
MSKKLIDLQSEGADVPFFAHLLSSQADPATPAAGGGGTKPAPTYHCLDSECTKKYPSDADEPTSPTWDK